MKLFNINEVKEDEVLELFLDNEEVVIECYSLTQEDENCLINILKQCLDEIGKEDVFDYLRYCYKELLINSKRANVKRIYFEEKKIDINNSIEYEKHLVNFKKDLPNKYDSYDAKCKEQCYYIRSSFKVEDDIFFLSISNKAIILDSELQLAREKIEEARTFPSIEEAFASMREDPEGAGLGIIILILMLRKIGLSREAFNIYRTDKETISTIMIPLSLITSKQSQVINDIILNEIEKIPTFPDNIIELQKKLENPDVNISELYKIIIKDPSLVAEILRISNSSIYILPKRVASVIDALKLIGLNGLKKLLYSYASQKILNEKYDIIKIKEIWEHSNKVAFFSLYIAKQVLPKDLLEDAYIAGLLHDIGKIILLGINSDIMKKISLYCQQKSIPVRIIEDITSGYNHSLIGSMIARKWNFPDKFIFTIGFHNNPLICEDKYKNFVFCIYLANIMAKNNENIYANFKRIDNSILYFFKIQSFTQYESLVNEFNELYKKEKIKLK